MGEPVDEAHDRLDLSFADIGQRLARGVADRRSAFHVPTIATIGLDGRPRLRTVVLRGFDAGAMALRFHTDTRSEKCRELVRDARVAAHMYDALAKLQLRIEGVARLHRDDDIANAAWAGSQPMSRACYAVAPGPGEVIAAPGDYALPATPDEVLPGRANFAAVIITIATIEWLHLAHRGHRRAIFAREDGWAGRWLVP
jgi:pyridoxamine 5'-phosphate oxidase